MGRYHGFTEQQYQDILKRHTAKGGVGGGTLSATRPVQPGNSREPVANPAPSPYKSKWEASYAGKLDLEQRAGIIKQWWYEPFSLWLPGKVRYKPDFLVEYQQDMEDLVCHMPLNIVEVKGGWTKNGREDRDGVTRLKIAAALFPCFRWLKVSYVKGAWKEEAI